MIPLLLAEGNRTFFGRPPRGHGGSGTARAKPLVPPGESGDRFVETFISKPVISTMNSVNGILLLPQSSNLAGSLSSARRCF